jgi:hypothetical protein
MKRTPAMLTPRKAVDDAGIMQFDLQLTDGQQVTGRYQGDVMVVD